MTPPIHANVSQVAPNLWIGGDLQVRQLTVGEVQLAELVDLGITDIVDCRLEWSDEEWVANVEPQLGYLWHGVDDAGRRIADEWFDAGTGHILRRLSDGGIVLAHCHMGINRGPSLGFAAMLALGLDPIDALDRIRQARPIAHIGYAEDALDWWLRKTEAAETDRRAWMRRLCQWRRDNHLDVANIIRQIRLKEGA